MTKTPRAQLDAYLPHLDRLMRRGRDLRETLTTDPAHGSTLASTRLWQQDCAALIHQLSGGSKAHWLARGYSDAFLVRSTSGRAVEEADVTEIVDRIVGVLGQAGASLARMDERDLAARSAEAPPPTRRFEFVHNARLRPILAEAFADGRRAFEDGDFHQALILSCSVLEAIITDALEYLANTGHLGSEGNIADWSFEMRIASAERAGLIRGGCARLPQAARRYRDLTDENGELRRDVPVSEHEARLAGQVLRVVTRDLDPGR
jgi:hypothetical protein